MKLVHDADALADRALESWFAASIANYVSEMGERPEGAIMILISEDGTTSLTHLNTTRYDLAMGGARLLREATDD